MFKKTAIWAVAFAAATLATTAVPAQAFILPPGGETLTVIAYYSDGSKTQLVGQSWSGCGQPSGSWGTTTSVRDLFFPAC